MFISNLIYFIIALGVLVTIHEYGHFWVARKLGVKVLTFSVGFGTPIWQRTAKDGVRYVIAAIPLGGYVKMLDEREADVAPEDLAYAFNRKSVWKRMAIVLAGPIANFILAIFLYWWMFVLGITGLTTQVGKIDGNSIVGKAGLVEGDRITAIDGNPVTLWNDLLTSLVAKIGDTDAITLTVESTNSRQKEIIVPLKNWQVDTEKPKIFESLGLRNKYQDLDRPAVLANISKDSPAFNAGLNVGDKIVQYNDEPVSGWKSLVSKIEIAQDQRVKLLIERDGELQPIFVVIGSHNKDGKTVGFLGVTPQGIKVDEYLDKRQGGIVESLGLAFQETGKMISLTVSLFKKLLIGDISPKSLSGPLSIAEGAGTSARSGLVYFISFIAMISVNLGFINLLPIPMLDGGHFMYYAIEAIKGKPLSEKVQEVGMQIGMLMVFCLMAFAIFNDFSRL
ncbi:RIP metalloprotease RseP [Aliikangiella sp. IMCC44653]